MEHLEAQLAGLECRMSEEREVWRRVEQTAEREKEALQQALSESQSQQQLRAELEVEAVSKRRSTASLDLDLTREIDHLNKVRPPVPTVSMQLGSTTCCPSPSPSPRRLTV